MSSKKAAEEGVTVEETAVTEAETEAVPETEAKSTEKPEKAKADKKFPVDNLRKNARALFGVSSCTMAGATAGLTGEYSVAEMKSIVDKWCRKEVK